MYQHFKFTRTATRYVLTWGVAVPAVIAFCAWKFDVSGRLPSNTDTQNKFDWAGKLRGESLLRVPENQKQDEQ